MKKYFAIILPAIITLSFVLNSCSSSKENTSEYKYESVENDPIKARIYTLNNGLKVYLSVNKDEPRVQTQIAVRAGSKNDPADCTGLAHYLEHMLFKGTSKIATSNWEEEKKILQQISDLFEEHKKTDNDSLKKSIYQKIDSLSYQAAKIAIPNEYDKMVSSIGATGTNAFTSDEMTVYINDIPSNEIEKWLLLESERFGELVLRLFHTELETVYEEFNRGQDNDYQKVAKVLSEALFKKHPYGTQPTIGHGEHLKNPSLVKIHEYFTTYYVPNNMAISISGDINPDETIKLIDQYFGKFSAKPLPEFKFEKEDPITAPVEKTVYGPMAESVRIAYRTDGAKSKDAMYIKLIDNILNNGQAGLIDLDLVQKQKVLRANAISDINHDYSSFQLFGMPRQNQSLDEVKDLLLGELDKIKKGDFDDWILEAILKDMRLNETRENETNWVRAFKMTLAFILDKNWKDVVNEREQLQKITKKELVDFANQSFGNNYVVVKKLKGKDTTLHKVDKPKITKLDIERNTQSDFYKMFDTIHSDRISPDFVDYKSLISDKQVKGKIPFSYIKNTTNDLFYLYYVLDMGSDHDKKLSLAVKYLPYLGTSKYSAEDLKKELFKNALGFDVYTSRDRTYIFMSGLDEDFEKGVELFEHVLSDVKPDEEAYSKLIDGIAKERSDAKLNKGTILRAAMLNYAKYGDKNPFKNILSTNELNSIKADELAEKIKSITSYKHRIFYYGTKTKDEAAGILEKFHKFPETLADYPAPVKYTELNTDKNKVLFTDYDMVQAEMLMLSKGNVFTKSLLPESSLFNEYFGSGLSSIVFQEIREAKALAYSAYCYFSRPNKTTESHYVQAYIGTQADKQKEAVDAMLELMNNMPEAEKQFEDAKLSAMKVIETERITKTSIFWSYESAKDLGFDYDFRKDIYNRMQTMKINDLKSFFEQNIKGKKYNYLVVGKKSDMDLKALKPLGEYEELSLEKIFGY